MVVYVYYFLVSLHFKNEEDKLPHRNNFDTEEPTEQSTAATVTIEII